MRRIVERAANTETVTDGSRYHTVEPFELLSFEARVLFAADSERRKRLVIATCNGETWYEVIHRSVVVEKTRYANTAADAYNAI